VDGVEDENRRRREFVDPPFYLISHFWVVPRAAHAAYRRATVKREVLADWRFSSLVSMPAALTCTGFRMSMRTR